MSTIVLFIHILLAVSIVVLVLMQQGRASTGGIFGGGASQTVFGSRGSFSFLMKITAALGAAFFITSTWLSVLAQREAGTNIDPSIIRQQQEEVDREQQLLEQLQQGSPQAPSESPQPSAPPNQEQPVDLPTFDEQP